VRARNAGKVQAKLRVRSLGRQRLLATGLLVREMDAGEVAAFSWDMRGLGNGQYTLEFEVPSIQPRAREELTYHQVDVEPLLARRDELRQRFRL